MNNEVDSHLDVSNASEQDQITDDPVMDNFEKNRSQVIRNGSRIVISQKRLKPNNENLQILKNQISENSTKPDSHEVATHSEVVASR